MANNFRVDLEQDLLKAKYFGKREGLAWLEVDYDQLAAYMKEATGRVEKVTQSANVSEELAITLVKAAQPLMPYKQYYTLKSRHKTERIKIKKRGQKTRVVEKDRIVAPSEIYYRMVKNRENKYRNTTTHSTVTNIHTITETRVKNGKSETKTYSTSKSSTLTKGVGLVSSAHTKGKRREYWKEDKDYRKHLRYREEKTPEGGTILTPKFSGLYEADFKPHLNEIENSTSISIKNNRAVISVRARKPRNKKFTHEGGEEYGALQYFAQDANWNRTSFGTTSRWLEVAAGKTVTGVAVPHWSGSAAVHAKLVNVVAKEMQKGRR